MLYGSNHRKSILLLVTLLFSFAWLQSKAQWQSRNAISVAVSLTDKVDLTASHLRAYDLNNKFNNIFYQSGLQVKYELSKRWDLSGNIQFLTGGASNETRTRAFIRAAHTYRLTKKINWTNSIRLETNSQNENRFRHRIGFATRLGLRKRLDFLNLSPSVTYQLFYNIGGTPIRYYNDSKQLIARQSPDGLHRSRIILNLNSKLNKYLNVSLYYMRQQEFNFLSTDTRKMNVYDPVRNRTLRPFDNFNTIGLSAQINLNPLFN